MARRAANPLIVRVKNARHSLDVLYKDLRQHGDLELSDAVKRARRELDHSSVTNALNQVK